MPCSHPRVEWGPPEELAFRVPLETHVGGASMALGKFKLPPVPPPMTFNALCLAVRRSLGLPAILGIMTVGFIALAACGQGGAGGGDAPDFEFSLYQGEEVLGSKRLALSDLRGRPLVINFWAGLCPPCRAELPDLQAFYDDLMSQAIMVSMDPASEVTLVSVDVGRASGLGSQQDALDLLEELDITFPVAYAVEEQQNQVFRGYRILNMPTTFFITAEGNIFRKWAGALNRDLVQEITQEMLSES